MRTSSIWLGKTLTPRMMSMSSLRPIGLLMRMAVRPQTQGSELTLQRSRVR